jgi:small subunit ribosomal protein S18
MKKNNKKEISIEGLKHFDYKDTELLSMFVAPSAQIMGKKRTGISSKQQRAVTLAIKRARYMGLLNYVAS